MLALLGEYKNGYIVERKTVELTTTSKDTRA